MLGLEVLEDFFSFPLLFGDFLDWMIAAAALGCIAPASEQMLNIFLHRAL